MAALKNRKNLSIGCLGLLVLLFMIGRCSGDGDKPVVDAPASDAPAANDQPDTSEPAATDEPAATEAPTEIPPTEIPPEPIHLEGSGQTATDSIDVAFPLAVASFTHSGQRNFIVKLYPEEGREDLLVNTIGDYTGHVLLPSSGKMNFDIDADGAWTIDINPVGRVDTAAFDGHGDMVSGVFDPPDNGPWEFSHDGERNFIVKLMCAGGTDLVQNELGPVSGSGMVRFDDGPCLWSVQADGNWSLSPR